MPGEAKLQGEIIRWLKEQQVYVVKVRAAPGVPVGCPDIIGLYRHRWLAIEVKASLTAKFQTGQQATLDHLKRGNEFVYAVCPETWLLTKAKILTDFL